MEGSGNSTREPGRLQNMPEHSEASNLPQQSDLLNCRPTGHVNPFVDLEINKPVVIQLPLQAGGDKNISPLSLSELFELSAHPIVTLFFFFKTKNARHRAITS
jgi:hypothetical protein